MPREAQEISVLAELERAGVHYEYSGSDDVKIKCPFHDDQSPSCDVSISKRVFKCKAANCPKNRGDIITLLSGIVNRPRAAVLEELATRYDLTDMKIVEPEVIERWHTAIWQAGPLLAELYKRCVTNEDIIEHKLGEDRGRITIPIPNERDDVVNVRSYLPGAPGSEKMKNQRGRGSSRFFPVSQLRFPAIMLCGGEIKAIVAMRLLNPHGIGALCATQAEDLLPPALLKKLAGKVIYVCEDIDEHGRAASERNCVALKPLASEVHDILLPLDKEKYPKGDINDFIAAGGDLLEVIHKSEPWVQPAKLSLIDEPPSVVHLNDAVHAKYAAKRVAVSGVIAAMDTAPYVIPREVMVNCDRSQPFCSLCPVWPSIDNKFEVHPEHGAILSIVAATKRQIPEALMEAVGIPRACRVCEFTPVTYYNAEDVRLTPQLAITERAADQRMQPAICIGTGLETNESYDLVGRMYPHPATQQSTLLISKYDATRDALSTYQPRDVEKLKAFQPTEWTLSALEAQLDDVYDDFERNVTRIRCRRDMHTVIDLVYHSPLLLLMDNRIVKGWVEGLIVGDSAQGKSEASIHMMKHYGLGERMDCKNASVAGLLGGLQQIGNGRWFVTWGFIPRHDRRLVILEELKGTSVEVISKLTDMRSSGIAELTKIEKRRTHARTRILAISNARFDRRLESYNAGIEAVKELIGSMEDIRRFDVVQVVADNEVDAAEINRLNSSLNGDHPKYGSDLCRSLLLWTWTRGLDQCPIPKESALMAMTLATEMCEEFTDSIPIVDRGSMRYKIARLAASIACRTFSVSDDMQSVVVRPCHVEWVAKFLRRIYSTKAMGYREYTAATRSVGALADAGKIKSALAAMPFPHEVVESFLRADRLDLQDIQDWCGWDRIEAMSFLSLLVRKHALKREYKGYRKTGPFIALLKSISDDKGLPGRPDFIPETEF